MDTKIKSLLEELTDFELKDKQSLETFRLKFISKKGAIAEQYEELKQLPPEAKKQSGKILNDLKTAGVVESRRGVAGGYRLARRPEEITLAVIIRHIEGALAPVSCVSESYYEKCTCPDESRCAIRSVMKEVREAVVKIVERTTIAELCERWRQLQQEPLNAFDFSI